MKLLLQFRNGVSLQTEASDGQPTPDAFIFRTPEGAAFYFEHSDDLPSGAVVFKEFQPQ